jgi:cell division protein FtsQ
MVGVLGRLASLRGEIADGRRVLPRFLRRPARWLARSQWHLPPFFGLKAAIVFFLGTAIAGVTLGGHVVTVVSAVTSWSGLGIQNVKITGQSETSEVDVLQRLDLGPYPSIVTFDVDAARERVRTLPWVADATIRKLFPDTVEIAISERTPYAIWQHGAALSLIDRDGTLISNTVGDRYAELPLVVGEGAAERVTEYTALLDRFPELKPRVKAGTLVSARRWNLVLEDGVEIMLPEAGIDAALKQVIAADHDSGLLSRDIVALDLRIPDEFVVRLSERARLARDAALKEAEKLAKKKGTQT